MIADRYAFQDPEQAKQFQALLSELRCVTCPNQNLLDSHLPVAEDLKRTIYQQIRSGSTQQDIKQFLVERYGDRILYDPPLHATTVVLWLGPWLMLLVLWYKLRQSFDKDRSHSSPR